MYNPENMGHQQTNNMPREVGGQQQQQIDAMFIAHSVECIRIKCLRPQRPTPYGTRFQKRSRENTQSFYMFMKTPVSCSEDIYDKQA